VGSRITQDIRPVEIPYGVRSFVDEIEGNQGTTIYYFVVSSDERGHLYDIPIIFSNTISIQIGAGGAISQTFVPEPAVDVRHDIASTMRGPPPAPVPPAGTPAAAPEGISSLEAVVQGERVVITFNPGTNRNITLYRRIRPISYTADLLGAVIVQTRISSPFIDHPVPGIPYFYALVSEDDLVRGTVVIAPGLNATMAPVQVPLEPGGSDLREIRAMPLPGISVWAAIPGMNAFTEIPPPMELSPQTLRALEDIPARPQGVTAIRNPRMFSRDMGTANVWSEEFALASIVQGSFAARNWEAASRELTAFLALPRSPEVTARARFYLGQCWYFLRRPREGLFEFLAIQDRHPVEAMEWIQASLNMIKEQ
jgi:hypothetical protein